MDSFTNLGESLIPLVDVGSPPWLPQEPRLSGCLDSSNEFMALANLIGESSATTDLVTARTSTTAQLQAGDVVTGFVNALKDHDWYKISLTAGQTYTFNLAAVNGSSLDAVLALRNSAGTVIASNDDSNGTRNSQIRFTASTSGNYFLDAGASRDRSIGQYSLSTTAVVAPVGYNSTTGYGEASVERAIESLLGSPIADLKDQFSGGLYNLYGLDRIGAPEAWSAGYTGAGLVVAVIDTGVDRNHVDLDANTWMNANEIANDGIDNDGNGFVDDLYGWNFVGNNNNTLDDNFHGTHVAGTIAAENNGIGVTGVAYNAKIMAVKAMDANGSGTLSNIAKGILYAADNGANVINLSLGGTSGSSELQSAVGYAWNKGVAVMMAAGNESGASPIYPAAYATQFGMAIGAIGSTGALASFSNRAGTTTLDYVTAAGVNVYSTSPDNAYRTLSGTSMATPVMAGAMALLMQANKASDKNLSLAQLETLFTSTARNSLTAGTATTSSGNSTTTASIQGIGQEALVTTEVEKPVIAATAPEQSVAPQGSRKVQASDWQSAFRTSYGTTIATHPARQVSTTPNTRGAVADLAEIQFSVDRSSSTTIAAEQAIMAISTVATPATLDAAFSRTTGAEALIDPLTGLWNQPWRVLRA